VERLVGGITTASGQQRRAPPPWYPRPPPPARDRRRQAAAWRVMPCAKHCTSRWQLSAWPSLKMLDELQLHEGSQWAKAPPSSRRAPEPALAAPTACLRRATACRAAYRAPLLIVTVYTSDLSAPDYSTAGVPVGGLSASPPLTSVRHRYCWRQTRCVPGLLKLWGLPVPLIILYMRPMAQSARTGTGAAPY
jgi:hypothetical protein